MLWLKILHIFFMISAFAGIFYLPRLFVYHIEAEDLNTKKYFLVMERRLLKFTTMLLSLALLFGVWLTWVMQISFDTSWILTKIIVAIVLSGYLFICSKILKGLELGRCSWSSAQMRLFNELPVVLLFIAVLAAVFKYQ